MATDIIEKIWVHKNSSCVAIVNGYTGTRCGYCSVSGGHPFFKKHYCDAITVPNLGKSPAELLRVHGGITYSGDLEFMGTDLLRVDKGLWWFGFDCNHHDDLADNDLITDPISKKVAEHIGKLVYGSLVNKTHKTRGYVIEECESLAEQLSKFFINSLDFIVNK